MDEYENRPVNWHMRRGGGIDVVQQQGGDVWIHTMNCKKIGS
jgi:hypothetical protein